MIGLGEIAHNVIFGPKWSEFGPIWSKRAPVVFWRSFKHRHIVRHQYLDMSTAICQNWLFDSRENQITDIVKGHTLKKGVARYHFWNKMGPTRVLTCISLGYFQKNIPCTVQRGKTKKILWSDWKKLPQMWFLAQNGPNSDRILPKTVSTIFWQRLTHHHVVCHWDLDVSTSNGQKILFELRKNQLKGIVKCHTQKRAWPYGNFVKMHQKTH